MLTLTLTGPAGDTTFKGRLAKEGPDAGKFLGTVELPWLDLPRPTRETTKDRRSPRSSKAL